MASVLFVCWHNAARSQMAEAFFERRAGSGHRAVSAGTHASRALNLRVIEVMSEVGIDLSQRQPRQLTNDLIVEADVIVSCLAPDPDDYDWPGAAPRRIEWRLPLPPDESNPTLNELRLLRDTIASHVSELIRELNETGGAAI
jgi:arsenate reductase (thioredoxin)